MRGSEYVLPLLCALFAAPAAAQSIDDPRLDVDDWVTGLSRPVTFTFIGDEDMLVIQRDDGRVRRVQNGSITQTVLDLNVNDGGGLGIVADPNFAQNGYVYVYYGLSTGSEGGPWEENRVERYTFNGSALVDPFGPLFTVAFDPQQANADDHNSGVLRFGPDGMLYGQVGDKRRGAFTNPRIEQNTSTTDVSMAGGIFRLTPLGGVPADNPFLAEPDPSLHRWFVYGFRNSLGMDFDPVSGSLWFGENGPCCWDELNRASAGMNSGWLKLMGPDARDATYTENGNQAFDSGDLTSLAGSFYRDPELSWFAPIGVTSVCFLGSKRFPEDLQDVLLFGETNFGQLYKAELTPDREALVLAGGLADQVADNAAERDALVFGDGFGVTTDMQVGPDGYIYVVGHFDGRIRRIRPLVDLFEPTELTVTSGEILEGSLTDLERSDDNALVIGPDRGGTLLAQRAFELTFVLNQDASPDRLDLTVESRGNRAVARQRISIFRPGPDTWEVLDVQALPTSDSVVNLDDLPNPSQYVDAATRAVRVRIEHESPDAVLATPVGRAGLARAFETQTDQVRLEVTWP